MRRPIGGISSGTRVTRKRYGAGPQGQRQPYLYIIKDEIPGGRRAKSKPRPVREPIFGFVCGGDREKRIFAGTQNRTKMNISEIKPGIRYVGVNDRDDPIRGPLVAAPRRIV